MTHPCSFGETLDLMTAAVCRAVYLACLPYVALQTEHQGLALSRPHWCRPCMLLDAVLSCAGESSASPRVRSRGARCEPSSTESCCSFRPNETDVGLFPVHSLPKPSQASLFRKTSSLSERDTPAPQKILDCVCSSAALLLCASAVGCPVGSPRGRLILAACRGPHPSGSSYPRRP